MPKKKTPLEKGLDDFGEETGGIGGGLEKKGKQMNGWFDRTFGVLGPFLSSLFGAVLLAVFVWVLEYMNLRMESLFASNLASFIAENFALFFLFFLFSNYASFIERRAKEACRLFKPAVTSAKIVIFLWVTANAFLLLGKSIYIPVVSMLSAHTLNSLWAIFVLLAGLGYIILIFKGLTEQNWRETNMALEKKDEKMKKLYRSGKNKLLGGVCGGIGEYLNVDPVIIRIVWIVVTLVTLGVGGILAYIIAWIIIPKNPKHAWKE